MLHFGLGNFGCYNYDSKHRESCGQAGKKSSVSSVGITIVIEQLSLVSKPAEASFALF